jgi:hypothetical protein
MLKVMPDASQAEVPAEEVPVEEDETGARARVPG